MKRVVYLWVLQIQIVIWKEDTGIMLGLKEEERILGVVMGEVR